MSLEILKPELLRPIEGVLFDMDGLVLDTECLYTRFWMEAAQEMGYPMSREQALGMRSLNREYGQNYLTRLFGPGVDYTEMRNIRIRRMTAWIDVHGVQPKAGIQALLDCLKAHGIPCAITSSSPLERIQKYLTPWGLYDRFQAICSGYEVQNGKPAPDIYLYGAKSIGIPPEACLALEDSPAGIESGFRAGCLPVIIPDQDLPSAETLSRSFARADRLDDLCGLFD